MEDDSKRWIGFRWVTFDLVFRTVGGLVLGAFVGYGLARLVLHQRRRHGEAHGLDTFLMLGILSLTYAAGLYLHVFAFLAVFAAGQGVRWIERSESGPEQPSPDVRAPGEELATDEVHAPAYLAHALLERTGQIERVAELALVVLIGALLAEVSLGVESLLFALLLIVVIRPVSVGIGLLGTTLSPRERGLTAWFGLRGIGSLYYLAHAVEYGIPAELSDRLVSLTLVAVAVSIVVHGVSATPLLALHGRRQQARRDGEGPVRDD